MKKLTCCILLAAGLAASASAGEKGWFGFVGKVRGSGFLNPTVSSVLVDSIVPNSPAAQKGVAVGDEIVQVEKTDVPGHKASELKPLIEKQVGETLHLKLKRPNGETYSVSMVAVKRP